MIGYKAILFNDLLWRKNQGGLFLLSPPGRLKNFDHETAKQLLKTSGQLFIRWESKYDKFDESCWWHVIKDDHLSLDSLSSKMRNQVRRGAKSFVCKPVSRADILSLGYCVYKNSYARYETHENEYTKDKYLEMVSSLHEQTEFWGVFSKSSNKLVAFHENYVEDNACHFISTWFDPLSLKDYSSYVLFYEMTRYYLEDRSFRYVSNGTRNISHDTNIHDFLIYKFNFRKAYSKLNVEYVSWLRILVTLLYPMRQWIVKIPFKVFQKVSILLAQEDIRRSCARLD